MHVPNQAKEQHFSIHIPPHCSIFGLGVCMKVSAMHLSATALQPSVLLPLQSGASLDSHKARIPLNSTCLRRVDHHTGIRDFWTCISFRKSIRGFWCSPMVSRSTQLCHYLRTGIRADLLPCIFFSQTDRQTRGISTRVDDHSASVIERERGYGDQCSPVTV